MLASSEETFTRTDPAAVVHSHSVLSRGRAFVTESKEVTVPPVIDATSADVNRTSS
jgi:hypothetical protein